MSARSHEQGRCQAFTILGLQDLVLAQARRTPLALAVVDSLGASTYGDVERESAGWARSLVAMGAEPGHRVGVALRRTRSLPAALIGVLRAGCAYVPLDPSYPADWLANVCEDAALGLILWDGVGHPNFAGGKPILTPDDFNRYATVGAPINVRAEAGQPAYLIYTSGSSGRPKGVNITHGNAVNLINWASHEFSRQELSAVLAATSISFDLSIFEIFAPLSVGGAVVLVPSPVSIADEPPPHPPTLLNTVPSVMTELIRLDCIPPSVRAVNLAGEPLPAGLAERIWALPHITCLRNLYGPAETTTYSTCGRVLRGDTSPAVGRPIDNTQIYVLDGAGERVDTGEEGEIFIGGAGVGHGYWRRPKLTKERFAAHPFDAAWPRVYRTGDIGLWRRDGTLECRGRLDDQVKIRGVRVELAGIEARLRSLPGVRDSAVVAKTFGATDKRLAAFVVPEIPGAVLDVEELRRQLRAKLPEPMVPTNWRLVQALPRLGNGKLDRRSLATSLPVPTTEARGLEIDPLAATIAREMAAVLNVGHLAPDANFLAAGGDSLRAAEVAARLRRLLNLPVPAWALLRMPTATSLAGFLEQSAEGGSDAPTALAFGPAPLSDAQRRLWLFNRLYPASSVHNVGYVLRWRAPCPPQDLLRLCELMASRHLPLRAYGIDDQGCWAWNSGREVCLPSRSVDVSGLSAHSLSALAQQEVSQPFDLRNGPPWRVVLLDRGRESPWLVLTLHQILVDRDSIAILLRDLGSASPDEPAPETTLAIYRAAANQIATARDDSAAAYWADQFAAPLAEQSYPVDADGTAPACTVARWLLRLDPGMVQQTELLGRREATTPFVVLLTALALALGRWSGRDDLLIGAAFSLRDTDCDSDRSIGFFAQALPLRILLKQGESSGDLLRRVHDVVIGAQQHKHCPASSIQSVLGGANSQYTASPLPVLFGFLRSPDPAATGLPFELEEIFPPSIEGELHLQVRWSTSGASLMLDGDARRYSERALGRLGEEWAGAVDRLSGRPAPATVAQRPCLVQPSPLFAALDFAAENHPDKIAIASERVRVSYSELRSQVLALGEELAKGGSGRPCGLLFEDQGLAALSALACLQQHRTFVPLGAFGMGARRQRLAEMLQIDTVLAEPGLVRQAGNSWRPRVIEVAGGPAHGKQVPDPSGRSHDLAYVLLTSGSTGKPKGIGQSQANLLHHVRTYSASLSLGPQDRVAQLTTIEYDAGLMDVFGALVSGASLHAWRLSDRGLKAFDEWLAREEITILHVTPSVFRAITAAFPDLRRHVGTIRAVVLGGETAGRDDLIRFQRSFGRQCVLVNGFGPTESTTATQAVFRHDTDPPRGLLPIGHSIGGVEIRLVNDAGDADPDFGEIELAGPHLFRGYIIEPGDLERLQEQPHEWRRHRTGDLARRLPDGSLVHVGRRDRQLKISGIRTEPAEIEQAILGQGVDVGEAAVIRLARAGGPHLLALVTPNKGSVLAAPALAAKLSADLPAHLLPNDILVMDRFPYLPNGKINRRALTRLAHRKVASRPSWSAPAAEGDGGDWEGILRRLWAEVLRLERMPERRSSFLALGGRSLEALMVMDQLRARFGVGIPARAMLAGMALEEAAQLIDDAGQEDPRLAANAAPAKLELAAPQRRFWLAEELSPGAPSNHVLLALEFPEAPVAETLAVALRALLSRHELLRSRIVQEGDELRLVVDDPAPPPVHCAVTPTGAGPLTPDVLPPELREPFHLDREWPFRTAIVPAAGRDLVVMIFHHVAVDAASVEIIARELTTLYQAASQALEPALPAAGVYHTATRRLADLLNAREAQRQLSFWRQTLTDAPRELAIATDFPRPPHPRRDAHRATGCVPESLLLQVDQFCGEHGLTRSAFMLAVWAVVLGTHSGIDNVVVGIPVSQRSAPADDAVVGPLINTVTLPLAVDLRCPFAELAVRAARQLGAALEHALVPFERVVEELEPARDSGLHPLYQASYSYHRAAAPPGFGVRLVPTFAGGATCDVALTAEERGGDLLLAVDMLKDLFGVQRGKRLVDQLVHVAAIASAQPLVPLRALCLLPHDQRHHLLHQINCGRDRELVGGPIADAIAAWASATPDAVAFTGAFKALTYIDLQRRSDSLAERLRRYGVNRGDFVLTSATPGRPEAAIAALAVWKTGAAFLPVDPEWPRPLARAARLDSGARVAVGANLRCTVLPRDRGPALLPEGDPSRYAEPLAYAMYTSGSTGPPKAATALTGGILNRFLWMSDFARGELEAPVTLQSTSAVHDSSVWQQFWPLTHGGRCVIPEPHVLLDAETLSALIQAASVTVLDLTPSVAAALLPEFEARPDLRARLRSIRWLILGGEPLSAALARRLRDLLPEARITNLYGPTEASIGCTYYELDGRVGDAVPIGRPIFNAQVAILNQHGQPVPKGAVGELWLLGRCVGAGYLEEGTLRGFESCPLPEFEGVPSYRTGDAARWTETNQLEFRGRMDGQVKLRGFRVDLDGVEAIAASHAAVLRAAAMVTGAPVGSDHALPPRLELVVKPRPGARLTARALRIWMRQRLPASNCPETVRVVDEFPSLASGKLDRGALFETAGPGPAAPAAATDPDVACEGEEAVRRAWLAVLPAAAAADLRNDDNFFQAGGHSFLLLKLREELARSCGLRLTILELFRNPTVRDQAALIDRGLAAPRPEAAAGCGVRKLG